MLKEPNIHLSGVTSAQTWQPRVKDARTNIRILCEPPTFQVNLRESLRTWA